MSAWAAAEEGQDQRCQLLISDAVSGRNSYQQFLSQRLEGLQSDTYFGVTAAEGIGQEEARASAAAAATAMSQGLVLEAVEATIKVTAAASAVAAGNLLALGPQAR